MSATDLIIRRATTADANEIARIHVDSWRMAYCGIVSDDYLAAMSYEDKAAKWGAEENNLLTRSEPTVVFIAENNENCLGFAGVGPSRNISAENQAEIYVMYLDPNHMGQGIGRALFKACMEHAKRFDFKSLIIIVMSKNMQGRNFYEHMGGEIIPDSERLEKIAGGEENVITYQWCL